MKKNLFSIAAAALALMFAACSKDATAPDGGGSVITPDMATSYAKIKIAMAGGPGTRAEGPEDKGYDNGTEDEAIVKSVSLVLYDAEGIAVGTGKTVDAVDLKPTANNQTYNADEYNNVVFQLDLLAGAGTPTKVLAYINTGEYKNTKSLTEALKDIYTGDLYKAGTTASEFAMTNAGYYKTDAANAEWAVAADLNADAIYASKGAAEATDATAAAEIYVERLAAKVSVESKSTGIANNTKYTVVGVDNTEYKLDFSIKRWGASGIANEMYAMKNQFLPYNGESWKNKAADHRSFWAAGVNFTTAYNDYLGTSAPVTYISNNEANNDLGKAVYVPEHTFDYKTVSTAAGFNPIMTATSAIILGQYSVKTEQGAEVTKFQKKTSDSDVIGDDFFLRLVGMNDDGDAKYVIYTEKELMVYLAKESGAYKSYTAGSNDDPATTEDFTENDVLAAFTLAQQGTVAGKYSELYELTVKEDATVYKADGETYDEGDKLSQKTNAMHFRYGWSYFYVPIEHYMDTAEGKDDKNYGVVRNTSYQLTIESISGLGGKLDERNVDNDDDDEDGPEYPDPEKPDPDDPDDPTPTPPNKPIVPDPDDMKDAYIKATLKVLSWHVISQGVDLN